MLNFNDFIIITLAVAFGIILSQSILNVYARLCMSGMLKGGLHERNDENKKKSPR